jgi:D-alanine-D-alanine ligase
MKIGLTYDLRSEYLKEGYSEEETAEFDKEDTIEGIESALIKLKHQVQRIGNIKQLTQHLVKGDRWDIVFNIAEGIHGLAREAQVPAILDAYNIPYVFSDAFTLALTLHKGMTKHVIRDLGLATPDFCIVYNKEDIKKIDLKFPLFAKPVAEGTGKGITRNSKISNNSELEKSCIEILNKFKQPVLVEKFLPGREFTVGIVGNGKDARVIGVMEILLEDIAEQDAYSFFNKENYTDLVKYTLIKNKEILKKCDELVLNAWRGLNCFDGGRMDVRMDENNVLNFIEVNPLAGLRPIHSDLVILASMNGIAYNDLIAMIFNSALKRLKISGK